MRLIFCFILTLLTMATVQKQALSQSDSSRVFNDMSEALLLPEQVYHLDLSKHRLKEFPAEITMFTNLRTLNLNKNKISVLPAEIGQLKHLREFRISGNRLLYFEPQICALKELEVLDLSNNFIESIPEEIAQLSNLRALYLWSNLIGHLPMEVEELSTLKVLDLYHNDMNKEEQDQIKAMLPNTQILLSLPCNCHFDDDPTD